MAWLLLTACSANELPSKASLAGESGADTEDGQAHHDIGKVDSESIFNRQILVTIVQVPPSPLHGAGSSHRQYFALEPYTQTERTRILARQVARDHRLREVEGWPIQALDVYCIVFEVPKGAELAEVLEGLQKDGRVESAQKMHRFRALDSAYNDPYADLQRGFVVMRMGEVHRWAVGRRTLFWSDWFESPYVAGSRWSEPMTRLRDPTNSRHRSRTLLQCNRSRRRLGASLPGTCCMPQDSTSLRPCPAVPSTS